jgi:hypothetical protein
MDRLNFLMALAGVIIGLVISSDMVVTTCCLILNIEYAVARITKHVSIQSLKGGTK